MFTLKYIYIGGSTFASLLYLPWDICYPAAIGIDKRSPPGQVLSHLCETCCHDFSWGTIRFVGLGLGVNK